MNEYVITFTNAGYVGAGEEPTAVEITVVCDVEPVDAASDPDVADVIVRHAIHTWGVVGDVDPEWEWGAVDWTLDEPGWEAALLRLPDGEVIDLG